MEAIREGRLGSEDQEAIEKLLQELMVPPASEKKLLSLRQNFG